MLYSFTLFMAQAGPYGSRPYDMNSFISYDFYGVAYRCFGSGVFWLVALILVPVACAALQLSIKIVHLEWFPDVNDIGRELDKGYKDGTTPTSGDAYVAGFSLGGLFDCKRAEAQVQHGVEIIASMARGPTFEFHTGLAQGPGGDDLRHGLPGAARRAGQRPGPDGGSI